MIEPFKKNAIDISRRAARAAKGVAKYALPLLFTVNAFTATAHAMNAREMLENTGPVSDRAVEVLDKHIKKASRGTKLIILPVNKVIETLERDGFSPTIEGQRRQITGIVKNLIAQDKTADRDTKNFFAEYVTPDSPVVGFYHGSQSEGPALIRKQALSHADLVLDKGGSGKAYAFIGLDVSGRAERDSLSTKMMAGLGEKAKLYARAWAAAHEAQHAGQIHLKSERNRSFKDSFAVLGKAEAGEILWDNALKLLRTNEIKRGELSNAAEIDSDLAGMRAVLDIAGGDKSGLEFVKAYTYGRVAEAIFSMNGEHNTFHALSKEVHKIDPSFPVLPHVTAGETPEAARLALAALSGGQGGGSNLGEPARKLLSAYQTGLRMAEKRNAASPKVSVASATAKSASAQPMRLFR